MTAPGILIRVVTILFPMSVPYETTRVADGTLTVTAMRFPRFIKGTISRTGGGGEVHDSSEVLHCRQASVPLSL